MMDVRVELLLLSLILLILLTAIELSLGGNSPYTSTDKKKEYVHINKTIQRHSTSNTKHSKYKCIYIYIYYQNTQ